MTSQNLHSIESACTLVYWEKKTTALGNTPPRGNRRDVYLPDEGLTGRRQEWVNTEDTEGVERLTEHPPIPTYFSQRPQAAPPPTPFLKWLGQNRCKICRGTKTVKLIWLEREAMSTLAKNINLRVRKKKKKPDYLLDA